MQQRWWLIFCLGKKWSYSFCFIFLRKILHFTITHFVLTKNNLKIHFSPEFCLINSNRVKTHQILKFTWILCNVYVLYVNYMKNHMMHTYYKEYSKFYLKFMQILCQKVWQYTRRISWATSGKKKPKPLTILVSRLHQGSVHLVAKQIPTVIWMLLGEQICITVTRKGQWSSTVPSYQFSIFKIWITILVPVFLEECSGCPQCQKV